MAKLDRALYYVWNWPQQFRCRQNETYDPHHGAVCSHHGAVCSHHGAVCSHHGAVCSHYGAVCSRRTQQARQGWRVARP